MRVGVRVSSMRRSLKAMLSPSMQVMNSEKSSAPKVSCLG